MKNEIKLVNQKINFPTKFQFFFKYMKEVGTFNSHLKYGFGILKKKKHFTDLNFKLQFCIPFH